MSELKDVKEIRAELITKIKQALKEDRITRKELSKKMGFSLSNINTHLQEDGPFTLNIDMLGKIGDAVAELKKEKQKVAKDTLERVERKLTA